MSGRGWLPDRVSAAGALATLLASSALLPLFERPQALWYAVVAVVVVLVVTQVQRRVGVPVVLVPAAALACLLLAAAARFAHSAAHFVLLPGSGTAEVLRTVVDDAMVDLREQTVPAPTTDGLMLLVFLGVGAVAVLVSVCVLLLRRPALAGLPLAGLLVVPAILLSEGSPWWVFVLGGAGYLNLLLSDQAERLGRWGQSLSPLTGADGNLAGGTGRRLGAAALGVAVLAPALVPGLEGGVLGFAGGGGDGLGNGKGTVVRTYNPIVSLRGQLSEPRPQRLFEVATDDPDPGYLRLTTLDQFNGNTWFGTELSSTSRDRVSRGLPDPVGLSAGIPTQQVRSQIQVGQLDVTWLPAQYPLAAVEIDGDWRFDQRAQVVWSPKTRTADVSYETTSLRVQPTAEQLLAAGTPRTEIADDYLRVPADVPVSVRTVAEQVVSGLETPYERAVALQAYFRSGLFTYSLETAPGNGDDALADFLENRRGYCEQFAAAMAVMARLDGIPSRVAIGFTPGLQQQDGTYLVTTADAHAWPELYFEGIGWLPFEPTPTGDGRATPAEYTTLPGVGPQAAPTVTASTAPSADPSSSASADNQSDRGVLDPLNTPAAGGADDSGLPAWLGWTLMCLVVLALLATLPWVARTAVAARRRTRWRSAVGGDRVPPLWQQLLDDARDAGVRVPLDRSPRQAAAALRSQVELGPDGHRSLDRLVGEQERSRYARDAEAGAAGWSDVEQVRSSLLAGVGRRRSLRARLLPTTAVTRAGARAAGRFADLLDVGDRAGARVRRSLGGMLSRSEA